MTVLLLLPSLLLLLHSSQHADACSATSVKEIQTKIVNGKLAAIRCSDIQGILAGGSLLDPATYIECVPGRAGADNGCTGGAGCSGYRCACPDGLVYIGALGCTDVNECALPDHPACAGPADRVACVNLQGSFACNCTQLGQQYHPARGCTDSPECVFPFAYKGRQYTACTSADRGFLWCGVTANVDLDDRWVACPMKYGTAHCVSPTKYGGEMRAGCFVDKPTGKLMCALSSNYDEDKAADLCMQIY